MIEWKRVDENTPRNKFLLVWLKDAAPYGKVPAPHIVISLLNDNAMWERPGYLSDRYMSLDWCTHYAEINKPEKE